MLAGFLLRNIALWGTTTDMLSAITKILSFFVPLLVGGGTTAVKQKVQGATTSLLSVGAVSGAVMWLLGPGREWTVTLNAMELSAVGLGAAVLYEWARRSDPPAPPPP